MRRVQAVIAAIALVVSLHPVAAYAAPGPVLVHSFGAGNIGSTRVVEFDASPSDADIDSVIGLHGSASSPSSAADLPVRIRLNGIGHFDVVNGAAYGAETLVQYTAGTQHHVKVIVNLAIQTYDVWLTQLPDGKPVRIAKDYAYATEAQSLTDVGGLYERTGTTGTLEVTNARLVGDTFRGSADAAFPTYPLESDNTGAKVVRFDVTASSTFNEVIGFTNHGASVTAYSKLGMIVRMSGGIFDAFNTTGYAKVNSVAAVAGQRYHVRLVPDFAAGKYSVWVAPSGGTEFVQVAADFGFRSTAGVITNVGQITTNTGDAATYVVDNNFVLDSAQVAEAVAAVNAAATVDQMKAALTSNSLGLWLGHYGRMPLAYRDQVAQDLLDGKAAGAYPDDMAILLAFEKSVAERRDITPPTAPTDLAVTVTRSLQAKVTWTAATDDAEIQYYQVFRDDVEIATTNLTVFVDSRLSPGTQYRYRVTAYDTKLRATPSAEQVSVTTVPADQVILFPLNEVNTAFSQALLKYNLIDSSIIDPATGKPYKYIQDWHPAQLNSAFALYYLTIAAGYDPGYLAPDGVTTVSQRAVAQIRSVISGGAEPSCSGNGLNGEGYNAVLQAIALAKNRVPAIWNELTGLEKVKVGLLMKACLVGAHWAYRDKNNFSTGIDQIGNFSKEWNPNYRQGGVGPAIAAVYYFGAEQANEMLLDFNYTAFMAELGVADFTNIATVFANTGKTELEPHTTNDGPEGFTYHGRTLSEIGRWMKDVTDNTFSKKVSPVGGGAAAISPTYPYGFVGFMVDGYDEYPNLGAPGMGLEFDSIDANGSRSSVVYVFAGWKNAILNYHAVMALGGSATGLSAADREAVVREMGVGTTDMFYKDAHGYNDYSKGVNRGTASLAKEFQAVYPLNKDLWYAVVDNPVDAVAEVNSAADPAAMKALIESPELGLVLFGYNALGVLGKEAVAQAVFDGRGGYQDKATVQSAVYDAVKAQGLNAVNSAATAADMMAAVKSNALGLYLPTYDASTAGVRQAVAQLLIDNRPAGGYPTKAALRSAVIDTLETVQPPPSSQLKNLPPVSGTIKRINAAEYTAWPVNVGEAHVALWNDDKAGAFTITIDDNHYENHAAWQSLSDEFGFKFTWFVVTRTTSFNATAWTNMLAVGQDVQSHTVNHLDSTTLSPEQIRDEYAGPIATINALPGGDVKTIAYPNGKGDQNIAAEYYIAGRGVTGLPNKVDTVNYLMTNSMGISSAMSLDYNNTPNGASIEGAVKTLFDPNYKVWNVSYLNGWTSVHYHGLTGLEASARYMLTTLDTHRDKVWTGTFTEVAMYAQERDTATVKVTANAADKISFLLRDQMSDELFDFPLTVKVRVDNAWAGVSAVQSGVAVPATVVTVGGNRYALVKAVPDKGEVTLTPAS